MSTAAKPLYLSDLHFEHTQWVNELDFFASQINSFENRLGEIAIRNTGADVKAKLEQYQNQFIRQKEVIDELKHKIGSHENGLTSYAVAHPVAIDHMHFDDHTDIREEMEQFRAIYQELKDNYYKFVLQWM